MKILALSILSAIVIAGMIVYGFVSSNSLAAPKSSDYHRELKKFTKVIDGHEIVVKVPSTTIYFPRGSTNQTEQKISSTVYKDGKEVDRAGDLFNIDGKPTKIVTKSSDSSIMEVHGSSIVGLNDGNATISCGFDGKYCDIEVEMVSLPFDTEFPVDEEIVKSIGFPTRRIDIRVDDDMNVFVDEKEYLQNVLTVRFLVPQTCSFWIYDKYPGLAIAVSEGGVGTIVNYSNPL